MEVTTGMVVFMEKASRSGVTKAFIWMERQEEHVKRIEDGQDIRHLVLVSNGMQSSSLTA